MQVYIIDQSVFAVVDEGEIKKMDQEITRFQEQQKLLEKECGALDSRMHYIMCG